MLEDYLPPLMDELDLDEAPPISKERALELFLNPKTKVAIQELDPGFFYRCDIDQIPPNRKEDLFMLIMEANYLGQGAGGGSLSIDDEEKALFLSLMLPYDMDYSHFRDNLEDFINYVYYWRDELGRHKEESDNALFS